MKYDITSQVVSDGQPNRYNEDRGNIYKNFAWVIDGATPLVKKNFFPSPSDAYWLAENINSSLKTFMNSNLSLKSIFERTIKQVNKEAFSINPSIQFATEKEHPCCTTAAVQINEATINYFVLCDCTIGIKNANSQPIIITDERHNKLDQECIDFIYKVQQEQNLSHIEAYELGLPNLLKKREFMNIPSGYGVLTLDGSGIANAVQGNISICLPCSILLCTDGFSRIFDLFKICSIDDLLNGSICIEDSLRLLRETECSKFPRYKMSDDATAVLIKIR